MVLQDLIGDAAGKMPIPQLRRQDGGVPSRAATSAAPPVAARAVLAPYPVGVLPTRRVASSYTEGRFFLHGGSLLPTRRIASPYTEGLGFLHGDLLGTLDCLSIVASVANIQFQSPIGHWQHWDWQHFHIGNIPEPRGDARCPCGAGLV